jgi:L-threonylcarbamoyladenylate synthase
MMNDECKAVDAREIGTDLLIAKACLERGELVGIPTETVYGLAANALDANAVLRIFQAKNRPAFDPLIVHTDSLEKANALVTELPDAARRLADAFWPGPLTLLLPRAPHIPDLVTSGLARVAIRIPAHPLTLALLQRLDFPLAAPSANPFGYISPTLAQHVADQLGNAVGYILDGGPARIGLESTIVGFENGQTIVYRLGGLPLEVLEAVAGPVVVQRHSTSNPIEGAGGPPRPAAPGMLSSHYAPRKPLMLLPIGDMPTAAADAGALVFREKLPGILADNQRVLSPSGDLSEAARNLFGFLRELDALPVGHLYAQPVPESGLGRAINDRLRRAAVRQEVR